MLRAKKPEAIQKRLKLFMFGPAGVGKTTAALHFQHAYIIDCEKGTEQYDKLINDSGSVVFQTTDFSEVFAEVKALMTEKHDYRTLIIDPMTTMFDALADKHEKIVGQEFGRHTSAANRDMKRLVNLIYNLDMNVIVTAHAKKEYGSGMTVIGQTFDGFKKMDYMFDLVLELGKKNKKRFGRVVKSRLEQFPDEDVFDWSYAEFAKRYGAEALEREAKPIVLATPEQVKEIRGLLEVVKLPDGLVEKWLDKAKVDTFEDMPSDTLAKCIAFVREKLPTAASAA
ncbi:MAG TPA: AAA family ATPase [Prosthecobacter sp.]|nr:AAA family ATPase [Prosthecobacter sp.]